MTAEKFILMVTYGQISVFQEKILQPFNDWQQGHVDQGFAWRDGCVSFRSLEESGQHLIVVSVSSESPELDDAAIRSIKVPFEVPSDGMIEIASISDSVSLELPAGTYSLRCDLFKEDSDGLSRIQLSFSRCSHPIFEIVRADENVIAQTNLLLNADPS